MVKLCKKSIDQSGDHKPNSHIKPALDLVKETLLMDDLLSVSASIRSLSQWTEDTVSSRCCSLLELNNHLRSKRKIFWLWWDKTSGYSTGLLNQGLWLHVPSLVSMYAWWMETIICYDQGCSVSVAYSAGVPLTNGPVVWSPKQMCPWQLCQQCENNVWWKCCMNVCFKW